MQQIPIPGAELKSRSISSSISFSRSLSHTSHEPNEYYICTSFQMFNKIDADYLGQIQVSSYVIRDLYA